MGMLSAHGEPKFIKGQLLYVLASVVAGFLWEMTKRGRK